MNRYNIFYQVHKGLKAMLYETALLLQQTDFTSSDEAERTIEQLRTVIALFDKHAHTEDTLVFDAMTKFEPSLVHAFEQEHVQDHELGRRLNTVIFSYSYACSGNDRFEIGQTIAAAFTDFMIFNLHHMAKEEDLINKALWKHYSDAELHAITQKIVSSLPSETMVAFTCWMVRGLNNTEIINWMKEVKNNAPDVVFQCLFAQAQQGLNSSRWQKIQEALAEGIMIA